MIRGAVLDAVLPGFAVIVCLRDGSRSSIRTPLCGGLLPGKRATWPTSRASAGFHPSVRPRTSVVQASHRASSLSRLDGLRQPASLDVASLAEQSDSGAAGTLAAPRFQTSATRDRSDGSAVV
ncbi:uncharacterized protein LOC143187514 [Calliopsis andreniformis]|uniref:uncharacterized protein LOC143187514 n=1 Tax=Calliopsis andreniformis TaxID=337506 RepID=UPI003FCC4202